jgi:hypothetical protein
MGGIEKEWLWPLLALLASIVSLFYYSVKAQGHLLPDKKWAATFFPYSFLFDVFHKEGNYYRLMALFFTLVSVFCIGWLLYVTLWTD